LRGEPLHPHQTKTTQWVVFCTAKILTHSRNVVHHLTNQKPLQNVSIDASMDPILQSDKDDCLFISYDELIEPIIENQGLKWYAGFYIQTN